MPREGAVQLRRVWPRNPKADLIEDALATISATARIIMRCRRVATPLAISTPDRGGSTPVSTGWSVPMQLVLILLAVPIALGSLAFAVRWYNSPAAVRRREAREGILTPYSRW